MYKPRMLTCCVTLCAILGGLFLMSGHSPTQANDEQDDTRIFELRTYTTNPGKLPELHARFRDHTMKLFEKHGMKNVIYWTPTDEKLADNTLVYIVSHKSAEAAKESWKAFGQDPQWQAAYKESIKDGKLVKKVERQYLKPTDFSPQKK